MGSEYTNHRGLVEAVVAMKMKPSSILPPTSCSEQMLVDSGGLDSGYGSQSSTPDSLKQSFVDPRIVAGEKNLWPRPFKKPTELKPYKKQIPELTHERFSDLRELYAENPNQFTRNLPNCQGILMSLEVLGESEETAEPWVFVQCDKVIAKRVRNFFKQPFIRKEFEPSEPTVFSPRLRVIVCPLKPRQLAKQDPPTSQNAPMVLPCSIEVFGHENCILTGTLCGTRIISRTSHGPRQATMGGVVEVIDANGEKILYGMTAGHFLLEDPASTKRLDTNEDDDLEQDGDDDDEYSVSAEFALDGSEEDFELDLSSFGAVGDLPSVTASFEESEDVNSLAGCLKIGNISMVSHTYLEDRQNLDWALTKIEERSFSLLNKVDTYYGQHGLKELDQHQHNANNKLVVMISARGPISGVLSNSWAHMMLPPGRVLTRTYLLTLSGKSCFQPGDSGAWVTDALSNEVYGHVVANDVFGRGYVIPMCDSFKDIKNQLSADSVSLPSEDKVAIHNISQLGAGSRSVSAGPCTSAMDTEITNCTSRKGISPARKSKGRPNSLELEDTNDGLRMVSSLGDTGLSRFSAELKQSDPGDSRYSLSFDQLRKLSQRDSTLPAMSPSNYFPLPDSGYSSLRSSPTSTLTSSLVPSITSFQTSINRTSRWTPAPRKGPRQSDQ